jgi:hypothetical protein
MACLTSTIGAVMPSSAVSLTVGRIQKSVSGGVAQSSLHVPCIQSGRLFVERCFVLLFMSLPKLSAMSLSFSFQWYLVTKYEFVFYQVTCASLHEVECKI